MTAQSNKLNLREQIDEIIEEHIFIPKRFFKAGDELEKLFKSKLSELEKEIEKYKKHDYFDGDNPHYKVDYKVIELLFTKARGGER